MDLVASALSRLSIAAVLCRAGGLVLALTPQAQAIVEEEDLVRIRSGRIEAVEPASDRRLQDALRLTVGDWQAETGLYPGAVVLRSRHGTSQVADVAPFPTARFGLRLGPAAIVVFQHAAPREDAAALLVTAFGLTDAKSRVALLLCEGQAIEAIAQARGVSVETVRNQRKSVFAKLGVSSRAALMRLLSPFAHRP